MKPYLIIGHNYKQTSAGVRALHFLAHSINEGGGEAYVVAGVTNPAWSTPAATDETIERIASEGVVVYPETDGGNTFHARRIARIILNVPGYIRGTGDLEPMGACFHYVPMLAPFVPKGSTLLTIPAIDLETFKPAGIMDREGAVFWRGKGQKLDMTPDVWDHTDLLEITNGWPADREVLAALFGTRRIFYSYTDYTMLVNEARLCGCPAVVIPSGRFGRGAFAQCPGGMAGLGCGPTHSEITKAMRTVSAFNQRYRDDMRKWPAQLARFLEITQAIEAGHV